MEWMVGYLDISVVPLGFIVYLGYHLLLLYRTLTLPETTYFGSEIHQRRIYLQYILQMKVADRGTFMAEMGSNITSANTYLASSVSLISIVGGLGSISFLAKRIIYGDNTVVTGAIKCGCIFAFGLVAILCFKEGADALRCTNFLITMPDGEVQPEYIKDVAVRGFTFCEVGNRSFYFSLVLVAWFFGPIPMLAACLILLFGLHKKDTRTIPSGVFQEFRPHIELSPV